MSIKFQTNQFRADDDMVAITLLAFGRLDRNHNDHVDSFLKSVCGGLQARTS